jgi:protein phosphatase
MEARHHPKKNLITRALGTSNEEVPDIFTLNIAQGDCILLCSDGLSDIILDSEFLRVMQHGWGVKKSCKKLIEMALERGAPDNITAVLFKKSN